MDLLMWVNYDLEKGLPTPAIIKPKPMWTGKQILSLVIPETINLEKISSDAKLDSHKDQNIIIQQGELLSGVMNKNTVGSAPGGLIHITWKDLGP